MTPAAVLLLIALLQNAPAPPSPEFRPLSSIDRALLPALPVPVPLEPGSVEGVVVEAGSERPLSLATVQLQTINGAGSAVLLVTNTREDGSFTFRSVPAGAYSLQAELGGYIPEMYGTAPDPYRTPTQALNPGQQLSGIRLALTPGAVITGRLLDDRGDVVAGTVVEALKTSYKNGIREPKLVQSAVSNDLGEYRFFMLRPGEYHIRILPSTLIPSLRSGSSIPFYFPGTIDVKASQSLDLHVGETLAGINFTAIPTRTRRITGSVQGNGDDPVGVVLSPLNGTSSISQTLNPSDPVFQFLDVAPGAYSLVARTPSVRAAIPLDVRNADMLNMRISLGCGFRIPGQIRIEGHPSGDDPELEKVYFDLRPETTVRGIDADTYSPFPNGRIALDVLPGDYRIDITQPEGAYVKSATLGGIDVLNQGLHITGSVDGTVEMVIASDSGSIDGRVEGVTAGEATIVLVPDAARRGQRALFKSIKVDPAGGFRFQKVPPGDYKLFAWTEENGGPWLDPEYLRKYEDRATPVHIDPNKKTLLERPIPVF